jgi:HK97 family phage portal protein
MFMPFKGIKFNIGDQTIEIPASEIKHIKMVNPYWDLQGTQLRGQSPLLAGIKFLSKNNEAVSSLKRSLENEGAKGFISPDASQDPEKWLTADQLPTLRQQLQKYWDGSMNKNRVGALGIPMQYQSIALSPVALDILKGMEYDDEKLCNLWGINPALFRSDSKFDNLNEAKKQLVVDVSLPFLKQLEQALSEFLLPAFPGEADYLDFDISEYSELNADSKLIMETFWHGGLATLNEVRTMLGFDEIDEDYARAIYTEANKITLQEAFEGGADFQDLNL